MASFDFTERIVEFLIVVFTNFLMVEVSLPV